MILSAEYGIDIDRPPDAVFDYLDDFANDAKWRANVVEMVPLGKATDPMGVWSLQRERRQVPGRIVETDAVITSRVRPSRLAVRRAAGPVRPEAIYELSPAGEGTHVDFRVDVELTGGAVLASPLAALLLMTIIKPVLPKDFGRLKQILEAGN